MILDRMEPDTWPYHCIACNMQIPNPISWNAHKEGKKHVVKEKELKRRQVTFSMYNISLSIWKFCWSWSDLDFVRPKENELSMSQEKSWQRQ